MMVKHYGITVLLQIAGSLEIPKWIRDNAKWWSEGLITDQDYINGLQYLISQGILKV